MRQLREEGYRRPVSAVVAATYCPGWSPSSRSDCLPATLLLAACEQDWQGRSQPRLAPGVVTKVLQSTGSPPRWSRLYLALTLLDPDDSDDVAHLPSLVEAAWKAGGYHLRLAALTTAAQVGRRIGDQARARLVDVLTTFDVSGNMWLSTSLVEALAACDAIEPMSTLDQIRAEIDAVLAATGQSRSVDSRVRHLLPAVRARGHRRALQRGDRRTGRPADAPAVRDGRPRRDPARGSPAGCSGRSPTGPS